MEKIVLDFLQNRINKLQEMTSALFKAHWEFSTTGTEELQKQLISLKEKLAHFLSNEEDFQKIKDFLNSKIDNDLIVRQLTVLYNAYLKHQIDSELIQQIVKLEAEIESEFTNFRANYNGKRITNNQILDILQTSTDEIERKSVWLSSKQIGQRVAPLLLKLVKLRNQVANKLGYANYYSLALQTDEINEKELFEILDRLKELTDEPFRKVKEKIDYNLAQKFGISTEKLMPWHYSDPFFQEIPNSDDIDLNKFFKDQDIVELSKKYYAGIGLNVEDILARSDLYEREGKDQHAYCIHIDGEGDIRILCNLRNTEYWMNTLLHELGHGVYDKYLDFNLPFILRQPAHTFLTEAIAMMFGRLSRDPQWLKEIAGASPKLVDCLQDQLRWQEQLALLIFIRWGLVMVYFERELYKNPEQNLNRLWWDLVKELQLLKCPANRENHPDWAAKIHLGTAPVYYHNYILGYLAAYQIEATIKESLQIPHLINEPKIGSFLIEKIFKPGARYHWNTLLEKATGRKLTPDFAVQVFK
ncbi:hypothetical protein BBF96_12400 [Anoxybacter fermentans]|uniref:Peptidase M3A and M3B thimet/oligopeptidase F n=1 Tax=Anoxybacter fermentans TaxID=1323375 RepID=A0A3Q9HRM7_9FIRM|nr:M2 family metallopeptidase [Anoxybacter fermentans]AZR74128.1 hypothetical protein BBF96_12400 [Anoxybacter fermentans]